MNLRYIHIEPSRELYGDQYAYEFMLRTRFISNFLSREIRKARFVTDGTFNMISVTLVADEPEGPTELVPSDCLQVYITFDPDTFEKTKGTTECECYLKLLEAGFRKAGEFKEVPLEALLRLLDEFRGLGYRNEWIHKKKRFKEDDLSVALNCYFTTNYFKLVVTIERSSEKKTLCTGILMETDPDEVCFQGQFKDIHLAEDKIVITDNSDAAHFLIDRAAASAGRFAFEINELLTSEQVAADLQ